MVSIIRGMLGNVLKINDSLDFAVLTECLWIPNGEIRKLFSNLIQAVRQSGLEL